MRASCCICSDIFDEVNSISATSCGHVYHSNCLMLWVGQRKTCPICRSRINPQNVFTLYFNFVKTTVANTSILENDVSNLKTQLSAKDIELAECKRLNETTQAYVKAAEKRTADLQQAVYKCESTIAELRMKVKSTAKLEAKILKFEQINTALTNDLETLNNVQLIVSGTKKDVENVLQECGNGSESSKQMATYCSVLKRELEKVIDSKKNLLELSHKLKQENCRFAAKVKFYEDAVPGSCPKASFHEKYPNSIALKSSNFGVAQAGTSASSSIASKKKSDNDDCIDTSPLAVTFKNLKFNMRIGAPSNISNKSEKSMDVEKFPDVVTVSRTVKGQNDENSVKRVGYNGLGGHSSFINGSGLKKMRSLKRKI